MNNFFMLALLVIKGFLPDSQIFLLEIFFNNKLNLLPR